MQKSNPGMLLVVDALPPGQLGSEHIRMECISPIDEIEDGFIYILKNLASMVTQSSSRRGKKVIRRP